MWVPAGQVAAPALAACTRHVAVGAIELARIPFGLVLTGCDGLWARAAMIIALGIVLGGTQRWDKHERNDRD
jgi:hypothetical protein